MMNSVRTWLLHEYSKAGIKGLKINTVVGLIEDAIQHIEENELFKQDIAIIKHIEIVMYQSGKIIISVRREELWTDMSFANPDYVRDTTRDIWLIKGIELYVDFNSCKFGDGKEDIKKCTYISDGEPSWLSECTMLVVAIKKGDCISVGAEDVVLSKYQPSLFSGGN